MAASVAVLFCVAVPAAHAATTVAMVPSPVNEAPTFTTDPDSPVVLWIVRNGNSVNFYKGGGPPISDGDGAGGCTVTPPSIASCPISTRIFAYGSDQADQIVAWPGLGTGMTIDGKAGDDTVIGGDGFSNTLIGGAGNDAIKGAGGKDRIYGGTGADYLDGGAGVNEVTYQDHLEGVSVTLDGVVNDGGAEDDDPSAPGTQTDELHNFQNAQGGRGSDLIVGDSQDNVVDGDVGDDMVIGGAGNDRVVGDLDNDFLQGDAGTDTLIGGLGNDVYFPGSGSDIVRDDFFIPGGGTNFYFTNEGAVPERDTIYCTTGIDYVYADMTDSISSPPPCELEYRY